MLKLLNFALLVAAIVGVYFAVGAGLEMRQLRAEHQALSAEVGLLSVDDPDKVHLVAVPSDDPLEFKWQMYVPAGFDKQWTVLSGGGGSGSSFSTTFDTFTDLVRVRVREQPDGRWVLWMKHRNGSNTSSISSREAEFFREPESLIVEQLGSSGAIALDSDKVHTLLRLSTSDRPSDKPLVDVRFGSQAAFQKLSK